MRRPRGCDCEDDFPYISGLGSMFDLSDRDQPEPRLWFAKSVSKAGANALSRTAEQPTARIGFHIPRPR